MSKSSNQKATVPSCQCGCGETTKGGKYLPGHDAKYKSSLVDAALGGSKRAANKLESLGWSKFLEAKRARQTSGGATEAKPLPTEEKATRKRRTRQKVASETAESALETPVPSETPEAPAEN